LDPELRSFFSGDADDGEMGWEELSKLRRVVLLAEAGAGKTEEMKAQARNISENEKFAFYATLQDVGRNGLFESLTIADQSRFTAWRASDARAHFFVDSIDEAKLDNVRFEQALRQIANAIYSAEGRAHILLSSRHTDWEYRRDLKRFEEMLPLPADIPRPLPSPDELLVKIVRGEKRPAPPAVPSEKPHLINPARVCGPYRRLGRRAFALDLASLCPLLQQHQNAPVIGQRCAGLSFHSTDREHRVTSDPRWASSPLRSDLGFRYTQACKRESEGKAGLGNIANACA
jgi:hypothetical protein